ncbi:sugar nucleotide-binding protein [Aeromicrobium sp. Marseille-Q0843]|uniref:Sugar nucleotide-binding protein n=1 Tax=Aeromicrobium phoceense TaxID=2754045 RepID=A0A838XLH7_9ACTN|nr:bifunctional dTDP-4-dehydrorhamnose 3,5-epimerase family protein/NAD(P)-dependent oxidoreductase [Aeromicrobium phoceense]MBA4607833.1 sugar nucleotide-binding protein [Aeromicrobium phoceense]
MKIETTPVPGLLVVHLDVHGDNRGWFKENWQREKMVAAGLPDFGPVQQNISFNGVAGTIRGIHAEPWDKYVSVASGRAFGAWVDLREGESFGSTFWVELNPQTAVFVPRGVANSFQVLEDGTAYSYLVNDHWRPDAVYANVNLLDPEVAVPWPLPVAEMSEKDRNHPLLAEVTPLAPRRTVVIGAGGQLGKALQQLLPDAEYHDFPEVDLSKPQTLDSIEWNGVGTLINAAAYTNVDGAETPEGRTLCWAINVTGVAAMARIAIAHGLTFVNVSSDYVFDGTKEEHEVDEPVSPLGVYGQTKAATEAVTSVVPKGYLVRTSWVVGEGANFVDTMRRLARDGVSPSVVDDQFGRLTPASVLAEGILDLLRSEAPYGIHHVTGRGPVESWADIARRVFAEEGRDPADVTGVSTEEYMAGRLSAPRPRHSALRLS